MVTAQVPLRGAVSGRICGEKIRFSASNATAGHFSQDNLGS